MDERGRPRTFDSETALDAAMNLFWEQGYEGSSLAELLAVMDLSRSSLYQSFGSKDELFRSCLDRYGQQLVDNLERGLELAPSGRAFLEGLLASVGATAGTGEGRRSCLMVNSVTEFGTGHEVPGEILPQALDRVTTVLVRAIRRAQDEGSISATESPDDLAAYLHVAISGLRTMIKAGASPESIKNTVTRLTKAL